MKYFKIKAIFLYYFWFSLFLLLYKYFRCLFVLPVCVCVCCCFGCRSPATKFKQKEIFCCHRCRICSSAALAKASVLGSCLIDTRSAVAVCGSAIASVPSSTLVCSVVWVPLLMLYLLPILSATCSSFSALFNCIFNLQQLKQKSNLSLCLLTSRLLPLFPLFCSLTMPRRCL